MRQATKKKKKKEMHRYPVSSTKVLLLVFLGKQSHLRSSHLSSSHPRSSTKFLTCSESENKFFDLFKVSKITNFLRRSHLRSSKNTIIQKYKKNHTNIKKNYYKKIIIIIIIKKFIKKL